MVLFILKFLPRVEVGFRIGDRPQVDDDTYSIIIKKAMKAVVGIVAVGVELASSIAAATSDIVNVREAFVLFYS